MEPKRVVRKFGENIMPWLLKIASGPRGGILLFWVAFFESTVLLFPLEILLIALLGVSRYSWWTLALIATVGSALGGVSGYFLGALAWQPIAVPTLELLGVEFVEVAGRFDILLPQYLTQMLGFAQETYLLAAYENWSSWLIVFFAISPLPFRLITMASGAAGTHLGIFLVAVFLARGLRFFAVSWLIHRFSERMLPRIQRYLLLGSIIIVVFACGVVLWRWIFSESYF